MCWRCSLIPLSTHSFFGKVKNSPWRMMEDSIYQGAASKVLNNLVKDLNELDFLNTPRMKFNAFIFGLLNNRVLDYWLTYICNHETLILTNYAPTAFVSVSQTTARHLFIEMTTALQPFAKIPFKLEYNFEYKLVKARQDEELSELLLHKHTTSSVDARLERILGEKQSCARPLSIDEALNLLSNSDDSLPSFTPSPSIKDSVQLKIDSLKQYSSSIGDNTREKTRSLLTLTGASIKQRFKQIQKQNRGTATAGGDIGAELSTHYLPGSGALLGNTRRARRQPMRVPHLLSFSGDGSDDWNDSMSSHSSADYEQPPDYTGHVTQSAPSSAAPLLTRQQRSQSLEVIPMVKDGEILIDDSVSFDKPVKKTSSLSDLVTFIGSKLFDLTTNTRGGQQKLYRNGVTSYEFESSLSSSQVSGSRSQGQPFMLVESKCAKVTEDKPVKVTEDKPVKVNQNDSVKVTEDEPVTVTEGEPVKVLAIEGDESSPTQQQTTQDMCESPCVTTPAAPESGVSKSARAPDSLSRTARTFTRRFGLSLISAFDKLLLDPKKRDPTPAAPAPVVSNQIPHSQSADEHLAESSDVTIASPVRKSTSATQFPKRLVQTLCSHTAARTEELAYQKGSILTVVKEVDKDWLLCYHDNNGGLVRRALVLPVHQKQS